MNLEAVIFDLDGTLIDSMGVWSDVDREFLKKRGIELPDNLFSDMKSGNSFEEVALYFKNRFSLKETIKEIMTEWIEMVEEHYATKVLLKKGVRELIDLLKRNNIKIGIGTSNSYYLAEVALKANDIMGQFDTLVCGAEEIKGKPFPDIFLQVADNLDVSPENCIVIEDVLEGVEAAKKADMFVIAIYDRWAKNKKEIKEKSDLFADNFNQIIDFFSDKKFNL